MAKLNGFDKFVSWFNPNYGVKRLYARNVISALDTENGYQIPGGKRKALRGSSAKLNSPARDIDQKLLGIRAISRDMSMNTTLATSIFRQFRSNVVGSGLLVQPRVDKDFLGITDVQADLFANTAMRYFDLWSNSQEGDFCGMATPNELEGLIYISSLINGDVFFAMPWVETNSTGWPIETTVKVIDADLVRTPDEGYDGIGTNTFNRIRNGIEFDTNGRLVAYWVADFYSDDAYNVTDRNWARIPVFDENGRRQMFHLLDHERVSQRRGLPLLAPVVENLSMISQLEKSELMSALVASYFSVFVRDQSGLGSTLQQGFIPDDSLTGGGGYGPDDTQEEKDFGEEFNIEMGYGNIMYLDDDKTIEIAETRDKKDFKDFHKAIATYTCSATGLPYEVVVQEFQKSYSAMRGAINEAWKKFRSERVRVTNRVKRVWYENVCYELVIKGLIPAPKFFDSLIAQKAWTRQVWIGAGQGSVDPLKEANASGTLIRNGMSTREEEYMSRTGERWDPMIERLANEENTMREKGLIVNPPDSSLITDDRREDAENG